MVQEEAKESRLSKRAWLIANFDLMLKEAEYYRTHKDNFLNAPLVLWSFDAEGESRLKINYVE